MFLKEITATMATLHFGRMAKAHSHLPLPQKQKAKTQFVRARKREIFQGPI